MKSRDSAVSVVNRLRAGIYAVRIPARQAYISSKTSILPLATSQPHIPRMSEVFSPRIKRPGPEAYRTPPSNVVVKSMWSCSSTPPILHKM